MNHLDVDINISREEIARLAKTRPFHKFVTFPIKVQVAEEVIKSDGAYCFPEDGNYTEKIPVGNTIRLPDGLKGFEWKIADFSRGSIGIKPEPLELYVEKDKMENKELPRETYISPFTGKVV